MGCHLCHDGIVGGNAVEVTLGLEGLLEDEVALGVEGDHHVLVAGASPDQETTCVIGKELAEGVNFDKDLIGLCFHGCRRINEQSKGWRASNLGLVYLTFWGCWARCPKIISFELGQFLATLE